MLIDAFEPHANFVSARSVAIAAPSRRVWEALPMLPVALRRSRVAAVAALPLLAASLLRGDLLRGTLPFGAAPWVLREGEVLLGSRRDLEGDAVHSTVLVVGPIDAGHEVVLLGRHRFASFATCFVVDPVNSRRSRTDNVTRATFTSGTVGTLYTAGVRVFHDAYTDWMLRTLRGLAEQPVRARRPLSS